MRIFKTSAWIAIAAVILVLSGVALADANSDVTTLSRHVIQPLGYDEIKSRFNPVHLRVESNWSQRLSPDMTRVTYYWNVQLPDGSMMTVPKSYDVKRTNEKASEGRFSNLNVYEVRKAGDANRILTVGVSPSAEVVVLRGSVPDLPAFIK